MAQVVLAVVTWASAAISVALCVRQCAAAVPHTKKKENPNASA